MKDSIVSIYHQLRNELLGMKKTEMLLSDRVKYERALAKLDAMKVVIDNLPKC